MIIRKDKCPLCGGDNNCGAEHASNDDGCWCYHTSIPAELLDRLPESSRGKACICCRCIESFRNRPDRQ